MNLPPSIWLLVTLAPLLGAVAVLFCRQRALPWLWLCCVPALLAAIQPPESMTLDVLWPGAEWGSDGLLTRAFLGFSALLWACASVVAASSMKSDGHLLRFWTCWLIALSGNLLLIIAMDGLSFYVGFSLMSLAAYGLVVHRGGPGPRRAGRVYLQLAVMAEMLLLAGLLLRVENSGMELGFEQWRVDPLEPLTALLLFLGLGLKMGFWPLHIWLPLAHPAAPAPASAVLSGAMIKAGALGLWRFLPADDPLLESWAWPLLGLGLFTAFYAVFAGLTARSAKAVLAFSSVSQMGYLLVIVAISWATDPEQLSALVVVLVLFSVHHGLAKGSLFIGAGLVTMGYVRKAWFLLLLIPALAIGGAPFTSGGVAKTYLKEAIERSQFSDMLLLVELGSAATMVLLLRALLMMRRASVEHADPRQESLFLRPALWLPWLLLSSMGLLLPWLWPSVRQHWLDGLSLSSLWVLIWPLLLAFALAWLAWRLRWKVPAGLILPANPAEWASLRFKRLYQRPPLPHGWLAAPGQRWRDKERKWNKAWQEHPVSASTWLLCLLLAAAGLLRFIG